MQITVLVENTSTCDAIGAEHGLSLYIETQSNNILFDMGQTELFAKNAELLGISLSQADTAVLSHGHYDHGGGLKKFLETNAIAPIYLSRFAFEPHFNKTEKYIGLDPSLAAEKRLIFTDGTTVIGPNLTLFDCNKENFGGIGSCGLTVLQNGMHKADDFRHEQYLLIEENAKKVLISGCSHKGIVDIAEHFKPDVLIGGFHFSKLELNETLAEYARRLDKTETVFYTCHCTGTEQFKYLKQYMSKLNYISGGQKIKI